MLVDTGYSLNLDTLILSIENWNRSLFSFFVWYSRGKVPQIRISSENEYLFRKKKEQRKTKTTLITTNVLNLLGWSPFCLNIPKTIWISCSIWCKTQNERKKIFVSCSECLSVSIKSWLKTGENIVNTFPKHLHVRYSRNKYKHSVYELCVAEK